MKEKSYFNVAFAVILLQVKVKWIYTLQEFMKKTSHLNGTPVGLLSIAKAVSIDTFKLFMKTKNLIAQFVLPDLTKRRL
jgi:hypothetical protein